MKFYLAEADGTRVAEAEADYLVDSPTFTKFWPGTAIRLVDENDNDLIPPGSFGVISLTEESAPTIQSIRFHYDMYASDPKDN